MSACAVEMADWERQALPRNGGWAAALTGTTGGTQARAEHVFDVRNRAELVAALQPLPGGLETPRIVRVHGMVNLSVDAANRPLGEGDYKDPELDWAAFKQAFDPATWGKRAPAGPQEDARQRSAERQKATVVIAVPSNTSLLGIGSDAGVFGGMLVLRGVHNIIVRNLHFVDAYDYFPVWDPKDNAAGEWNSEYDNISLLGATQVWIDHCSFSDGPRFDEYEPMALGRRMQRHDGLLDITRKSSYVTLSYNHFKQHDKTTLIGSGDGQKEDEGQLKVSLHHNWWDQVRERAPRVRYGQVHVYNNLYTASSTPPYAFSYSIGIGWESRVIVQNNAWETTPDIASKALIKLWKGTRVLDSGNLHNGQPVDFLALLQAAFPDVQLSADVGWLPTPAPILDAAAEVPAKVRAQAGAGRL